MENASKALLITAAVLIVIIIIALGIKLLGGIADTANQTEKVGDEISSSIKQVTGENIKIVLQKSGNNKAATIQLIKKIMQCDLKKAQGICNNLPQTIKEGITKEEAENIKKDFEDIGATVKIEGIFDQINNQEKNMQVVLQKSGNNKAATIQLIKKIMQCDLKKAQGICNNLPQTIKEGITKEEAENIKKDFESIGATVEIKRMS